MNEKAKVAATAPQMVELEANKNRILEVSYPDFILYEEYVYPDNWKLFKVGWDSEETVGTFLGW